MDSNFNEKLRKLADSVDESANGMWSGVDLKITVGEANLISRALRVLARTNEAVKEAEASVDYVATDIKDCWPVTDTRLLSLKENSQALITLNKVLRESE